MLAARNLENVLDVSGFMNTKPGKFASSTGGNYCIAQDGEQLARAFKLATLQHLPYEILDKTSRIIASGETRQLARDLPVRPRADRSRRLTTRAAGSRTSGSQSPTRIPQWTRQNTDPTPAILDTAWMKPGMALGKVK